jgi:CspA family cold shock protein
MYSSSVEVTNSLEILTGRVKWFNNKTGFGFITITDGSNIGSDVFVHHSSIKVFSEQYKYLVQGEYVEFTLVETNDSKHKYQAGEVKGIKGGQLMCETRKDFREARNNYKEDKLDLTVSVSQKNDTSKPKLQRYVTETKPDKLFVADSKEWTRVVKKGENTDTKKNDTDVKKRGRKPKV